MPFACIVIFIVIVLINLILPEDFPIGSRIALALGSIFMILSTVPSFLCSAAGLAFLIYARKKGGTKTVPFIVLCAAGMILGVLSSLFWFSIARGFESTEGQLEKLAKIPEIEEFVLTDDSEEGGLHDGIMYNDLDLYLSHDRFLQVSNMSEYMTSFRLNATGDWNLFVVYENSDKALIKRPWLAQEELSELCGKNIKKLSDLISCYDTLMQKAGELPLLEENPTRPGFFKAPLQKERLAFREDAIYHDLLRQEGVTSAKKISGCYDYLENYWYEITMDDGHTVLMTVSAVFPQDDGGIQCDFFIRSFDGEPISLLSMTNTTYGINYYSPYSDRAFAKKIGEEMHSYRDFFPHYKEFLELTKELLEESKAAKNDKNRNRTGGMLSGVYSPQ